MRTIVLLGYPGTKRTIYMQKAADDLDVKLSFVSLPTNFKSFDYTQLDNAIVKVDPLDYQSAKVEEIESITTNYLSFLQSLTTIPDLLFLNSIQSIQNTINKKKCKQILLQNNIPTTPMLEEVVSSIDELHTMMIQNKKFKVFIKPNFGSGAAGVCAYHIHPITQKGILYTSMYYQNQTLYNTKKLSCYKNQLEIKEILNALLKQDTIIEEWLPKAKFNTDSYDLRVVWQFNEPSFIVARRSSGPITNLHLNNKALAFEQLQLPSAIIEDIFSVCKKAVACFSGLQVVGIDILLSPSLKPYVIEMNAQGDLIYQDIYQTNSIYKKQIAWLTSQ